MQLRYSVDQTFCIHTGQVEVYRLESFVEPFLNTTLWYILIGNTRPQMTSASQSWVNQLDRPPSCKQLKQGLDSFLTTFADKHKLYTQCSPDRNDLHLTLNWPLVSLNTLGSRTSLSNAVTASHGGLHSTSAQASRCEHCAVAMETSVSALTNPTSAASDELRFHRHALWPGSAGGLRPLGSDVYCAFWEVAFIECFGK